MALSRPSKEASFNAYFLQAIDGVVSLALCPQVMSQAPQHFRSSEKQATCEGYFARQSICCHSLHPGMSRAVHPQFSTVMSTIDTFKSGLPIPLSTFCIKLIESVRMVAYMWSDCHLLRQSSGGHGWLLPPPLSSWRLRPYLHGR